MICDYCRPWCATTEKQLANRVADLIHGGPDTMIHPCPSCNGKEWATTDKMVIKEQTKKKQHRWGVLSIYSNDIKMIGLLVWFLGIIIWWIYRLL